MKINLEGSIDSSLYNHMLQT